MKWYFTIFIIGFLMYNAQCSAHHLIDSSTNGLSNSSYLPESKLPIAKPADGQGKIIAGTISICTGVGLLVGGSIVRYTSSQSNTINTGKSIQAIGICLIGLPLGIYVTSDGRIKSSRSNRNRKPRGFKNRHHYY